MKKYELVRSLKILGVDENTSFCDVQTAYRKLVLKYHPDVNRRLDAPRRFREIVEAYGLVLEMMGSQATAVGARLIDSVLKDRMIRAMDAEELEKRFRYSSSPDVRASAMIALVLHGGEGSRRILFKALRDSDERVRVAALQTAGTLCGMKDVPRIFASLLLERKLVVWKRAFEEISRILQRRVVDFNSEVMTVSASRSQG